MNIKSLYCCNLRPGCSFLNSGSLRSSKAARAAFCLRSGCLSIPATAFLSSVSPPVASVSASSASSIFEAVNAGPAVVPLKKSSRVSVFFVAFFSSPRATGRAGFEGNEARSASSRALFSAFLASKAFFLASSASLLAVALAPFDQSAASFRSSSS